MSASDGMVMDSSPFNSTGYWQTTVNDSGAYEIFVEASDGNLFYVLEYEGMPIAVMVFDEHLSEGAIVSKVVINGEDYIIIDEFEIVNNEEVKEE